ncbi:MAG: YtxH domain-containing protein [Alphaproteobacteria bacterium]|nr:YtxH domain-containing protein [Alphaproteobacteria bacterium]
MIKFILGLVVGLVAGLLISPELTGTDMNAVVHDARSAIGRHLPVNN